MKAMLIFNPAAGGWDVRRELKEVIEYLESEGWRITWRETWGPGDATTFAREAVATGHEAAIVAGGDGTLGEAAHGLAGSEVALGVLPIGVGNVWALQMGIPTPSPLRRHLLDAARVLTEGQIRRVDLGRAGKRHFLLWAGIGIDARVTERIEPRSRAKKRLGVLAYVVAAFLVAKDFRGTHVRATIDGRQMRTRAILMLISNAQLYARYVRAAPQARLDDGLLDICIFKGYGFPSTVHHAVTALSGHHLSDPQVEYRQARRVAIRTANPMPVQVDGDPIGTTPMEFAVVPRALNVIVPQSAPAELFSGRSNAQG